MQDLTKLGVVSELTLNNNTTIRYLKAGSGKPLLLMHTIRTQLDYFQEAIPLLAKHFTVYAIDLPGHGYSSIDTQANYDEPYLRNGVISFIEKLDLTDLTLVGESIGAVLALTVASQVPERVKAVVSSNTYDYDTRYADGVRRGSVIANFILGNFAIPVHGAIFAALENKLLLGLIMKGGLRAKRAIPDGLLSELNTAGRRKSYRYVERNVFAMWRSWGKAKALYAGVKAPVTLVYGDHDWSTIAERQRTVNALGATNTITLKDTGHFAFIDRPKELADIVIGQNEKANKAA